MTSVRGLAFLLLTLLVSSPAVAVNNRVAITDITTALRGGASAGALYVSVSCYYPGSTNLICAGGGDFDAAPCGPDTDNGATIIYDSTDHLCYYRKNFGFNGIIDARQCGVRGTGQFTDQDVAALQTCLDLAKTKNIPVVNTGGGRLRDDQSNGGSSYGQDIKIPGGITLSCGGGSAVGEVAGNDYSNSAALPVQHVIILDGGHTIRAKDPDLDGGTDDGANAVLDGCVVLRADENGADPYAPSAWHPNSLRDALLEEASFRGTGVTARSDFTIRNTTILGFVQCWYGTGARLSAVHAKCDGTAGFWADKSGGGDNLDDVTVRPLLTGNGGCGSCNEYTWQNTDPDSGKWNFVGIFNDGGVYEVYIDATRSKGSVNTDDYLPKNGDMIWIRTGASHWQSAGGRYSNITVTQVPPGTDPNCQPVASYCRKFDLPGTVYSDSSTPRTAAASWSAGSAAITGLTIDIRTLAVGMHVDSMTGCIPDTPPGATTITDINPAWNTIWISAPTTCTGNGANIQFYDDQGTVPHPTTGESATLTATERSGDGYKVTNAGGVTFTNCRTLNHYVGFHAGDGSNLTRFVNCANDNDSDLDDDSLIGLLCDGQHEGEDCADTSWSNGVLGQHATGSVVISSDSTHVLHISNAAVGPTAGRQRGRYAEANAGVLVFDNTTAGVPGTLSVSNGLVLASLARNASNNNNPYGSNYHAGDVVIENAVGSSCSIHAEITIDSVATVGATAGVPQTWHQSRQGVCTTWPANGWSTTCSAPCLGSGAKGNSESAVARLAMSNVVLPNGSLYLQGPTALASTNGCGNIFSTPVPFTCAPPSIVPPPQGRLTLSPCDANGCYPVMRSDVTGAGSVYYVPYVGQQVPIYSGTTGAFSPSDIGVTGLQMNLNGTNHLANKLYDVFVHLNAGSPEICSGPAWASSVAGTSTRSTPITQIDGIWVNVGDMTCQHSAETRQCATFECTYLGTFYSTTAGHTSQQFGPVSGNGGGAPCLCLYNAYNRVTLTSRSQDTHAAYTYNSSIWRYMENSANNRITVVDGLGQTQISAQLLDALFNSGGNAQIGIGLNVISPIPPPSPIVQANATAQGSYSAALATPPILGLWYAQALESAPTGQASFGGSGLQQLSVQVED